MNYFQKFEMIGQLICLTKLHIYIYNADAPDSPSQPEITKFNKSSVTLAWKAPKNDGGAPIKHYLVEKRQRGSTWQKAVAFPVEDTKVTVGNLEEGSEIEFRVVAVNEAGPSPPSKVVGPHSVRDPICMFPERL